jgi:Tfp pilus assembly protein PilN
VIARLNLSSDPFRNRTLPWTVAVAVSAVSLVALVLILAAYSEARAEADTAERAVVVMRGQSTDLERQAVEIKQTIPPEQRKTLEAAHALVSRKGFSWSQLFSDLESALPGGVRVQRINVREVAEVGDQTRADLELTVLAKGPTDVTGMITEMNSGGTFNAVPITENAKTGRGESGYEWVLRVSYVQRRRGAVAEPARAEVGEARPVGKNAEAGGAAKVE